MALAITILMASHFSGEYKSTKMLRVMYKNIRFSEALWVNHIFSAIDSSDAATSHIRSVSHAIRL